MSWKYDAVGKPLWSIAEGRTRLEDLGDGRTRIHFSETYHAFNPVMRALLERRVHRFISKDNDRLITTAINDGIRSRLHAARDRPRRRRPAPGWSPPEDRDRAEPFRVRAPLIGVEQLVRAARHGDAAAMDALVRELMPYVGRVCGAIALNRGDDAMQETFIAVLRNIRSLREPAAVHGWVRRIHRYARPFVLHGAVGRTRSTPPGSRSNLSPPSTSPRLSTSGRRWRR